jgi:hypothetical protein
MSTMGTPDLCEDLSQASALARVSSRLWYLVCDSSDASGSSRSDRKLLALGTGSRSVIFLSHGNASYEQPIFAFRSAATAFEFLEPWGRWLNCIGMREEWWTQTFSKFWM